MQTSLQSGTCSRNSMQQAQDWIDRCQSTHARCAASRWSTWIPTRLVSVKGPLSDIVARLCVRGTIPSGMSFLTLSHRWGSSKFTTLTF
ncbi:hypothetical protein BU23DRAFT_89622 [Bimuria novae-zelandiae CBS 107.79]|uniref:Uncharacterized protein n=1 Tax=Bimuria novae-zelandiae CBS 107.79 TaxID=1447943 RepID=A0A6A5VB91_9PLEO|nr:hypothetical protein BU23DRAFT_89622 [Bimuria novae-zelandiae CBS 107.79]